MMLGTHLELVIQKNDTIRYSKHSKNSITEYPSTMIPRNSEYERFFSVLVV
jgi:hypothetical protein